MGVVADEACFFSVEFEKDKKNALSTPRARRLLSAVPLSRARDTESALRREGSLSKRDEERRREAKRDRREKERGALSPSCFSSTCIDVDRSLAPVTSIHTSLFSLSLSLHWSCPPNHHRFSSASPDAGAADFGLAAADAAIAAAEGQ